MKFLSPVLYARSPINYYTIASEFRLEIMKELDLHRCARTIARSHEAGEYQYQWYVESVGSRDMRPVKPTDRRTAVHQEEPHLFFSLTVSAFPLQCDRVVRSPPLLERVFLFLDSFIMPLQLDRARWA